MPSKIRAVSPRKPLPSAKGVVNEDKEGTDTLEFEEAMDKRRESGRSIDSGTKHLRLAKLPGLRARGNRLSVNLVKRISGAPAKFRVASGTPSLQASFQTHGTHLSGWVMVRKQAGSPSISRKSIWKWRFLEVSPGVAGIYATEPPMNYRFGAAGRRLRLSMAMEEGSDWSLSVLDDGSNDEESILNLRASPATVKSLADRFMALKAPREDVEPPNLLMNINLVTSAREPAEQLESPTEDLIPALIVWGNDESGPSCFRKRFKSSMALDGLTISSEEELNVEYSHQLTVTNSMGQVLVISVPDALVMLQWAKAISGCDLDPQNDETFMSSVVGEALNTFVVDEARLGLGFSDSSVSEGSPVVASVLTTSGNSNNSSVSGAEGPLSEKVRTMLGYAVGEDQSRPIPPSEIKIEMMAVPASAIPDSVPHLKGIMADPYLRKWIYLWSRTQFSSENVKFWVACSILNEMETIEERANGIRELEQIYIDSEGEESVNIGGLLRKRIMAQIQTSSASGDEALAALLPDILHAPLLEIRRVIEHDILPNFSALLTEVIRDRSRPSSSSTTPNISPRVQTSPGRSGSTSPKRTASAIEEEENGSGRRSTSSSSSNLPTIVTFKHVRDVLLDETAMQDLLLFTSPNSKDQEPVAFLILMQKFRAATGPEQINMALFIKRKFLDSQSASLLEFVPSKSRKALLSVFPAMFDQIENDVCNYVDAKILPGYIRAREPSKKTKTRGIFSNLGKKSAGRLAGRKLTQSGSLSGLQQWELRDRLFVSFVASKDGDGLRDAELVFSDPGVDPQDKRLKDVRFTSLFTGNEGLIGRADVRLVTKEELAAYDSLALDATGSSSYAVGDKLTGKRLESTLETPKALVPLGVLRLRPGDCIRIRRFFLKTGWAEVEAEDDLKGLFHISHLKEVEDSLEEISAGLTKE